MNIVVLDSFTLNPGDLDWGPLRQLGDCSIYDRSTPEETFGRAAHAEIILANKALVTQEHIQSFPKLRYIGVLATGFNNIDVEAAKKKGVPVCNVPAYGTRSVAQMTFALLLELAQRTGAHAEASRAGRWSRQPDFCFWEHPLVELEGLAFGVIGFGKIGRAAAKLAEAFGMRVLVHTNYPDAACANYTFTGLDSLLEQADVVSLHCPLTAATSQIINQERLQRMKKTAFLINTSRGALIDEPALASALNQDRIAGAGLDVLSVEPPPPEHPLLHAKNCIVTPHIAWATRAARSRLLDTAVGNVRAFLDGQPRNVVNG